jgi:hypothetical protein
MNSHPFWYKLIYNWSILNGNTGLTLPYILGAVAFENKSVLTEDDINDFIIEVLSTPLPYLVTFKKCPNIGEKVFGFESHKTNFSLGVYLSDNLYVAQSMINDAGTIDELLSYCKINYTQPVLDNKFSWKNFLWQPFEEPDYDFIKETSLLIIDP